MVKKPNMFGMRSQVHLLLVAIALINTTVTALEWDQLKLTWLSYAPQPRRLAELPSTWQPLDTEDKCNGNGPFYGTRYVRGSDRSVILIFDANGYIAGIQTSVNPTIPPDVYNFADSEWYTPEDIDGTTWYTITAYFVSNAPETVCAGRSSEDFDRDGTGDLLQFYMKDGTFLEIPNNEDDVVNTQWDLGSCFISMGVHYWYNYFEIVENCQEFKPAFLLYNGGVLKGWGWATFGYYESDTYEHPEPNVIGAFMNPVPPCLTQIGTDYGLTTQHVYFRDEIEMFC
ncbi:unnamed protein product [Cyprideis torosa]|uniref:Uncharacterized protein n=1 Tax=Cyprideis torosa TaxID=163714 RepID=A0A7R8ZKB2_9CRUS|nr:unnamed protein product [Cyprideis torosa]CAG0890444.1 unnamed protein product [Cyprideis torosa]